MRRAAYTTGCGSRTWPPISYCATAWNTASMEADYVGALQRKRTVQRPVKKLHGLGSVVTVGAAE